VVAAWLFGSGLGSDRDECPQLVPKDRGGNLYVGEAVNGMRFEGYYRDGYFTSIYPVP